MPRLKSKTPKSKTPPYIVRYNKIAGALVGMPSGAQQVALAFYASTPSARRAFLRAMRKESAPVRRFAAALNAFISRVEAQS